MKKLMKSILIATAAIGSVAGSTAAVVSCGGEPTKSADQLKYEQQVTDLVHSFTSVWKNTPWVTGLTAGCTENQIFDALALKLNDAIQSGGSTYNYLDFTLTATNIKASPALTTSAATKIDGAVTVTFPTNISAGVKINQEAFTFPIHYSIAA